jgi:lysophospholipase L1-like esterase
MRRIISTLAVAGVVATAAVAGAMPALAAHHTTSTPRFYYLSLGDSLARGVQPTSTGTSVETNAGYPDQLFTALHLGNPLLHLVKLGCPGETTQTMISGGICTYGTGSQLHQAVAFLKQHAAHTELVTIDIGANDLNPCLALSNITDIVKCLNKVFPKLLANLATIMTALRGASSTPVKIIGMTYYDPELANWLKGTAAARTLAKDSIALAQAFANDLTSVYTKFGAPVADVFTAFKTASFNARVTLPAFGSVPKDVGLICSYTWMCAAPPVGPNIHANRLGYALIANTFLLTDLG